MDWENYKVHIIVVEYLLKVRSMHLMMMLKSLLYKKYKNLKTFSLNNLQMQHEFDRKRRREKSRILVKEPMIPSINIVE